MFAQADTAHTPAENAILPRPGNEIVCIVSALLQRVRGATRRYALVRSGRGCMGVWLTPHHRGAAPPLSRVCSTARLRDAKTPERQSRHTHVRLQSPHKTRPGGSGIVDRWTTPGAGPSRRGDPPRADDTSPLALSCGPRALRLPQRNFTPRSASTRLVRIVRIVRNRIVRIVRICLGGSREFSSGGASGDLT